MKFQNKQHHVIDMIFPIALLFVFAISTLSVLLLSASVYRQNTDDMQLYDEKYTPLAYITEKVRQNDTQGSLSLTSQENTTCLTLSEEIDGTIYNTYIYAYEGMLKELYVPADVDLSLKNGNDIMVCSDLSITELEANLFRVTTTDQDHKTASLIVGERSGT